MSRFDVRNEGPALPVRPEPGADPGHGLEHRSVVRRRPAETAAAAISLPAAFAFLVDAGVSEPLAAVLALLIASVPGLVSWLVDAIEGD